MNFRYSIEEDSTILDHVQNSNEEDEKKKFATLAKLLNRTRMSVYRRYQILKQDDKKLKGKTLKQKLLEMGELEEEKNEEFLPSSSGGSEDENNERLKPKKPEAVKKRGRKRKHPEKKKIQEEIEKLSEDDIEDDYTLQLDEEET